MVSSYIVQETDGTICPKCRRAPRLLARANGTIGIQWPAFYLCQCGFVGQVGVGPVTEVPDEPEPEQQSA